MTELPAPLTRKSQAGAGNLIETRSAPFGEVRERESSADPAMNWGLLGVWEVCFAQSPE